MAVPGNHDRERAWQLGWWLKAWFRGRGGVTIDAEPSATKYLEWGHNLIRWDHGDVKVKPEHIGLQMAQERPEAHARAVKAGGAIEWHAGHLHHEMMKDIYGTVYRWFPTLCPADAWHSRAGYRGSRAGAQALTYSRAGFSALHQHVA